LLLPLFYSVGSLVIIVKSKIDQSKSKILLLVDLIGDLLVDGKSSLNIHSIDQSKLLLMVDLIGDLSLVNFQSRIFNRSMEAGVGIFDRMNDGKFTIDQSIKCVRSQV
jgi:hypothetical protein